MTPPSVAAAATPPAPPSGTALRWFNPREMDDDTIRLLSVGRDALLADLLRDIQQRLQMPGAGLHWLVTGNYGAGKSYFLRLLQAHARERWPQRGDAAPALRVVLLPEELHNVGAPHDLLHEVRRMRRGDTGPGRGASWRTDHPQADWQAELDALLGEMDETLLIVGVENLHVLLKEVFADDIGASLLRQVLLHEPRIMWVATSLNGNLDAQYGQRLFRQFQHHPLPLWGPQSHRDYLVLRGQQLQRPPSARQLVHIDAFSRFTGGNPRVAALLADAILGRQDMADAGDDLNTALDLLSKYYTEQLVSMATNARRCFDALLRGGEPASQVQVAARMPNARQSDIARPFGWLVDTGHVQAERVPGDRETHYRTSDRLFAQWYRMRYIEPGQRAALAVMADLIADTLDHGDKWGLAARMAQAGRADDAHLVATLALRQLGGDVGPLLLEGQSTLPAPWVQAAGRLYALEEPKSGFAKALRYTLLLLETYRTEAAFLGALQVARQVALSLPQKHPAGPGQAELVTAIWGSLELDAAQKLRCLRAAGSGELSASQGLALAQLFREEQALYDRLRLAEGRQIDALETQRNLALSAWPRALTWLNISSQIPSKEAPYRVEAYPEAAALGLVATAHALLALRKTDLDFDPQTMQFRGALRHLGQMTATWDSKMRASRRQGFETLAGRVLQRLVDVWPKAVRKSDKALLGHCHYWLGRLAWHEGRYEDLRRESSAAVRLLGSAGDLPAQCYALGDLATAEAETGDPGAAVQTLRRSVDLGLQCDAWALPWLAGQYAQRLACTRGAAVALEDLAALMPQLSIDERSQDELWQQLADAVLYVHRHQGRAAAFDCACVLYRSAVSDHGRQPARLLRLWVIEGVDGAMDPPLLHDIIDQAPLLLPEGLEATDLPATQALLHGWLDELARPAADRGKRRTRMDPDQAITWAALDHALPFHTRLRLGLAEQPTLDPEAQALFDRMLALLA